MKQSDEFQEMHDAFMKKTPMKLRHSIAPPKAASVEIDEVDEIYKNPDPIGSSLDIRTKVGGHIVNSVPDKNSKAGKFFFTLRLKGPSIQFSEEAT